MMENNGDVAGQQRAEEVQKGRVVFEFDPTTGNIGWRKEGPPIPHAILTNALDLCKQIYLGEQLAMLQMRRTGPAPLLMPDGSPYR